MCGAGSRGVGGASGGGRRCADGRPSRADRVAFVAAAAAGVRGESGERSRAAALGSSGRGFSRSPVLVPAGSPRGETFVPQAPGWRLARAEAARRPSRVGPFHPPLRGRTPRRRPAGRRGVRPPMRADPGFGGRWWDRPRRVERPRAQASRGFLACCACRGGAESPRRLRRDPLRVAGPSPRCSRRAGVPRPPGPDRGPFGAFPFRGGARARARPSPLSLALFPVRVFSVPLRDATSDQTWRPAEFKHISQRRKRN